MPNQDDALPWHLEDAYNALVKRVRRRDYLDVYQGRGGMWRWRHRAGNHRILSQGEGYTRRHDAVRGAHRANPGVPVKG